MRPDALRAAIEADLAAGVVPAIVVATIGTTSTTAVDPLPEIGAICRGVRRLAARRRRVRRSRRGLPGAALDRTPGVEYADSYCFDPHKWLLTGFDCDAFWVADRAELIEALTVLPEYLRNAATESGAVHRLPGLAGAAGPPVPGAEAVVRAALVRRRGAAGAHPLRRGAGRPLRRPGRGRRPVRAGRAAPVLAGLLPAAGRRRAERGAAAPGSTTPAGAPDPHPGATAGTRCGWRSARR